MVLFLHPDSKLPTADDIDKLISAELPDKDLEPFLYEVVSDMMIHGPCGEANPSCVCMREGQCSKFFPKSFSNITRVDGSGFPVYRRRDDNRFVMKKKIKCSNKWVVPYNKELSIRYRAHINVEWCNQTRSIKYLFKYINKGPDYVRATIEKDGEEVIDEVKDFYSCRYISACEATWRILAFPIHYRTTAVVKLSFHLPDQQLIIYNEDDPIDDVLNKPSIGFSKFLAWMECNSIYPEARELTYASFPTRFIFNSAKRQWQPRKRGFAIGRITYVPVGCGEAYYLRVLLNFVKGPRSFEEIRTVDGEVFGTFKEACYKLKLLDDDNEYIDGITDASYWAMGGHLRRLFAVMLLSGSVASPLIVWEATWSILSEDLLKNYRKAVRDREATLPDDDLKNLTLIEIELILRSNGNSLAKFKTLPFPKGGKLDRNMNYLIADEKNYNIDDMREKLTIWLSTITDEQKSIYDEILTAVNSNKGGMFFVYGFGGSGKTYLWSILGAALRVEKKIVINVASSGIAALLLLGGRTAHSKFAIPLIVNDSTTCAIPADSELADLLRATDLIIWDEAPMMSKHCFETFDRTMRDILKSNKPFGGKVIVLGGDFRQILPVVVNAGRTETVMASLNSSRLWRSCKVRKLTKNMRVRKNPEGIADLEREKFLQWILDIGDGRINEPNTGEVEIDIPGDFLINFIGDPIRAIVNEIYGFDFARMRDPIFFQDRAILCPKHEDVDVVNSFMLAQLKGESRIYFSADSIETSDRSAFDSMVYSEEYLNDIEVSGLPKHRLELKIGVPIMLLRNIDPKAGLCNGTRLLVQNMSDHIIQAKIVTGSNVNDEVLIPRMYVTPPEARFPFRMRRKQFPVAISYAMTINKSQGQTLDRVGLYLPRPVFSHGQLYVAVSRVRSRSGLRILILDSDGKSSNRTLNVVFKEVFKNLC